MKIFFLKFFKITFGFLIFLGGFNQTDIQAFSRKIIKNYYLNNPVEYVFDFSKKDIENSIKSMFNQKFDGRTWGIYNDRDDGLCLSTKIGVKSKFHIPLFEILKKDLMKDPDLGGVLAIFHITLTEISPNKTKVKVTPIPGWYKMFVDSKSGMPFSRDSHSVSKPLPTSTFFEYTFLLKLGELLGEKNMPPINTDITKAKEVIT